MYIYIYKFYPSMCSPVWISDVFFSSWSSSSIGEPDLEALMLMGHENTDAVQELRLWGAQRLGEWRQADKFGFHRRHDGNNKPEISYEKSGLWLPTWRSLSQGFPPKKVPPPLWLFGWSCSSPRAKMCVFIAKVMDARGLSAQSHAEDLDVPGSHIISDISFVPKKVVTGSEPPLFEWKSKVGEILRIYWV